MFNKIINSLDFARKIFVNLIFLFFLFTIFLGLIIFPFFNDARLNVKGSILSIYSSEINETKDQGFFDSNDNLSVSEIIQSIDHASLNDEVTMLFIDLSYLSISNVSSLEIGMALDSFKGNGKKIIAYSDFLDQNQYLLASYADEIILNPLGVVYLEGFKKYNIYLKDALERFNLEINTYVAGEFKSATEIFTRSNMSDEDKTQSISYLNSLWNNWQLVVKKNRKEKLLVDINNYINNFSALDASKKLSSAEISMKYGFVDKILNRVELRDYLLTQDGIELDKNTNSPRFTYIQDYFEITQKHENHPSSLAIINATGEIFDGSYKENQISSEDLSKLIRSVSKDSSIKGLLLRINSPGGSGFASEIIRQELLNLKSKGIPIIVSMADIAASGGYWIAADADEIWASPLTLTGSIGVFAVLPSIEKALNQYGVNYDGVSTTNFNPSVVSSPSESVNKFMQNFVDKAYDDFINLVSEGRNLDKEKVEKIAKGRVWTGSEAKENGLIDNLGTQSDALKRLSELANINHYRVKQLGIEKSFFEIIKNNIFSYSNISLNVPVNLESGIQNIILNSKILNGRYIDLKLNCVDCLIQ
ncbi:signal peptide peptidase SppA [SAR86 cluster bacterium]|nr:signal peptide peptidase SppA [SAR86 cluster bacterium]